MNHLATITPPHAGVIGYCGYAGSGKTTLAKFVQAGGARPGSYQSIQIKSFASPLKDMLDALLLHMHVDERTRRSMLHGGMKGVPINPEVFAGLTTRSLMQTLGTEWGRRVVDPDLWVKIMRHKVEVAMAAGTAVIIDDVRFQNEVKMIHELGGKVVRIHRPGLTGPTAYDHVSETLPLYDETFENEVPA